MSVFADGMAKINPLVRIPSLTLDSGETLVDSTAILDHLDEVVGPERALTPRAGDDRRRVMQLTAIAAGTVEKLGAFVTRTCFTRRASVARNGSHVANVSFAADSTISSVSSRTNGSRSGGSHKPM
jgi:glutathione S-transferase